ncbi:MAG: flagellin [Bacteriovoracaceae bacterium]
MSMSLNNNLASSFIKRHLDKNQKEMTTAVRQISSGERISSASEDAAGIAISTHMNAGRKSLGQALKNANQGVSMSQTAEGATAEISNIIIRLRELSIQSASDTLGDGERSLSDLEFQSLIQHIDQIAENSQFNGRKLISGASEDIGVQVGTHSGSENSINVGSNINLSAGGLGLKGLSIHSKDAAQSNIGMLDGALRNVGEARASLGATQNRMQSSINNLEVSGTNLDSSYSRIHDADLALTTANYLRSDALQKTSTAVLAQSNSLGKDSLRLL